MHKKFYLYIFLFYYLQVGNIGGREFAESLAPDVQRLLVSDDKYLHPICLYLNDSLIGVRCFLVRFQVAVDLL